MPLSEEDKSPIEMPLHVMAVAKGGTRREWMSKAAFLLCAGVWYRHQETADEIIPPEDAGPLGLTDWRLRERESLLDVGADLLGASLAAGPESLGSLVATAYETRRTRDLLRSVLAGLTHPDLLVRACALRSALDMVPHLRHAIVRELVDVDFSADETAATIASMALAPVMPVSGSAAPPVSGGPPASLLARHLVLVHGTNFPPGRPVWSVPKSGPLFNYIEPYRPDIYGSADYFRWEGGYSDYAREVASYNLDDWFQRRGMQGSDVVTHSHGGNVLMAATQLGASFDRVLFLSCPVRWRQYQPALNSIARPQSVRIRLDFVILADRSAQRFPRGTIPERILPIWFIGHGTTHEPDTWRRQKLLDYLV